MVYACGAWRKQPSDSLRDGLVVDAIIARHSNSGRHQLSLGPLSELLDRVPARGDALTGQHRNHLEKSCGSQLRPVNV